MACFKLKKNLFALAVLLVIAACSVPALLSRWRLESADDTVAIIADYREVLTLARSSGVAVSDALAELKAKGVSALMVADLLGEDLQNGVGPASLNNGEDSRAVIEINSGAAQADFLSELLALRFGVKNNNRAITLPVPSNMLKRVGIIPDVDGLDAARDAGLAVFYRPAPTLGNLALNAAEALKILAGRYKISAFAPSGEIVAGYPDVSAMADVSRELNIPVASVEFLRQTGASALIAKSYPLLLSLHSVTNEELLARGITRPALRERLIRAALERSVRLLLCRAAPSHMGNSTFKDYLSEVEQLAASLKSHGFKMGWPKPLFADASAWGSLLLTTGRSLAAFALALTFVLCLYCYCVRVGLVDTRAVWLAINFILAAILAVAIMKVSSMARLVGAFAAPLVVTEASLAAMSFDKNNSCAGFWGCVVCKLITGVLVAIVGGLALAAFFSVPLSMMRLQTFSGVKLTLMLPPMLVLLHDLKNRVHPESLGEILRRPPLWGELALCGVLLAGLGIMVFRSGNVEFIPGFEANIRAGLERLLVARPRSKEVFLGYPSLLLLALLVRKNLWTHYREVLRIGVAVGLSSVVNSFCHFHTHILFILLREFNGLCVGLVLGLVLVLITRWVVLPLLGSKKIQALWS